MEANGHVRPSLSNSQRTLAS